MNLIISDEMVETYVVYRLLLSSVYEEVRRVVNCSSTDAIVSVEEPLNEICELHAIFITCKGSKFIQSKDYPIAQPVRSISGFVNEKQVQFWF